MGNGITYCDGCGELVLELDFRAGKAVALGSRTFCPDCVAKSPLKPPQARPAAPPASRPPSRAGAPAGGSRARPLGIAACMLAAGLCGAAMLTRKSKTEPAPLPAILPARAPAPAPPAAPKPAPEPAPLPPDPSPGVISPDQADDFYGKSVTVEFTVASVGASTRSDTVFLNSTARGGKSVFAAVIFKSARPAFEKAFGEDLEAAFKGRKVRVTGEVRSFKESAEIVLEAPGQVQFVR